MELFSFLVFICFVITLWEEVFTKETFMSRKMLELTFTNDLGRIFFCNDFGECVFFEKQNV